MDIIGSEKMPSILNDPFGKTFIKRVYVSFGVFNQKWNAYGEVEFKNGNTVGQQKFDGDTFDEVVQKIKLFISTLD